MKRRDFLSAAGLLGIASQTGSALLSSSPEAPGLQPSRPDRQYYELRKYHLLNTANQDTLNTFLRDAALPALNRLGIAPVGVFNVKYGPNEPTLYVLLPHPSLESVATLSARLAGDEQFVEEGTPFLEASIDDPAFVRMESSLKVAFDEMPELAVPALTEEDASRLFELRTYESHGPTAARRKVEMFNEGGEIDIFLDVGLTPVFFSETLIGDNLPNLTYMLVFKDLQERDAAWDRFLDHPDWKELAQNEYYNNTVSNIRDIILQPAPYSQI